MSAPNTDLETETRKSRWPLIGMALAVVFGVGAIVIWLFDEAAEAPAPSDPVAEDQEAIPPAQEGLGSVPAPEGVEPREVEPEVLNPTVDN